MKRAFLALTLATASLAAGESVTGIWDAKLNLNGVEIPFKIEFTGSGSTFKGWFFNGDEREVSTSGNLENGSLILNFADYAAQLSATVKDGAMEGRWVSAQKTVFPMQATRHIPQEPASVAAPAIDGLWEIEGVASTKGESTWRLIVQQKGPDASAAILRVDGDTGALTGSYDGSRFVLSHFSGARPSLLVLTPRPDGSLSIDLASSHGHNEYKALRPVAARAQGLPAPVDPSQHTRVKNPSQPFVFSFPDLNGKQVSNDDARFRGKVVLVNITGSWCPNCHDEAPFLAELYRKYRNQGLEIVALSFEEADQLKDPTRLRAFIQKNGIQYTVLLGGEPSEAKDKLTQAENWNAWPTTFFVDRDGLVRQVHTGFPSSASGPFYIQAKRDFESSVERLLADSKTSTR